MATYSLSRGAMDESIAALRKATTDIDTTLNDLESKCASSLADWMGEAIATYQAAKKQWDQACIDMNTILATSGRNLQTITDGYNDTERQNAASWG